MKEDLLEKKIRKAVAEFSELGPMLKGNLSKAGSGYQLTWKETGNKTKIIYVASSKLAEVEQMVASYKKAKDCLEKIAMLNAERYKKRT